MGLGSLENVSLAEARRKRDECVRLREQGIDPIEHRLADKAKAKIATAKAMTFDQCRDAYIASHRAGWRNTKHAAQWTSTLATYVTPVFGKLPVQSVDVALVMKALEPIWNTKPETASRVRGRIERVLDWAQMRGYRDGENPARWRGHLDHLLPARAKVRKVEHHAALPYIEAATFMAELRDRDGIAARALEFAILTAARTGEVIGMSWDEVDFSGKVWTVPSNRMKGGREHRVPLSAPAVTVLKCMSDIRQNNHVFPGDRRATLSNMALLMTLRRMGRGELTAHGFRSTFRDWAAERTSFSREVAEAALAHVLGDKTEAAYLRADFFDKRRRLMDAWAEFITAEPAEKHGKTDNRKFVELHKPESSGINASKPGNPKAGTAPHPVDDGRKRGSH
jgi:integrase